MKGRRTKDKIKAKVIEAKVNNPDITLREISAKNGLPLSTISDIIKNDLPAIRNGSERLAAIVEENNRIISIGKQLIEQYLPALEINKHSDLKVISDILDTSFKQNQLLTGNATERTEMSIEVLTDEQKRLIAKRYNS